MTGLSSQESQRGSAQSSQSTSGDTDQRDGLLPVVKFLQSALAMKTKGDNLHYQHVVAQLVTRDDPETLWRLYLGLCECITIISQRLDEFKELIDAVFGFDWCGDEKIMAAFTSLLTHLVSANGTCMVPAMHMLVRNLVVHDVDEDGEIPGSTLTRQEHVHAALQSSLALVPSGRSKLPGVLRRNYPHRRMRAEALSDYALQALRVIQYAPLVEESIVRLILEKCLEIDVEIKITDSGDAVVDEEQEEAADVLFTMDDVMEGLPSAKTTDPIEEVDEMADKLDRVMLVLFTYLDERLTAKASIPPKALAELALLSSGMGERDAAGGRIQAPSSTAWTNARQSGGYPGDADVGDNGGIESIARLLKSLLLAFEENILPTYRSKFVQFLLFFACGRTPGLAHLLVAKLVEIMRDGSRPKLIRHSSVAYLASFLARAPFVEASTVSEALRHMLEWADDYLGKQAEALTWTKDFRTPVAARVRNGVGRQCNSAPNDNIDGSRVRVALGLPGMAGLADHMFFYSVCQATFYVMCFRGAEMLSRDGDDNITGIGIHTQAAVWERLLSSSLQPLKQCLGTVRREFARLCCSLLKEYLSPSLVDELKGVAEEDETVSRRSLGAASSPGVGVGVGVGIGMGMGGGSARTPGLSFGISLAQGKVTKAGGLGKGSNPLDSFFPFDPYLLRRSHVYVDTMYNNWKSQEERKTTKGRRQRRRVDRAGAHSHESGHESGHEGGANGDGVHDGDEADVSSLSSREGDMIDMIDIDSHTNVAARARRRPRGRRCHGGSPYRVDDYGSSYSGGDSESESESERGEEEEEEEEEDSSSRRRRRRAGPYRKLADPCVTDGSSMSVTPSSSVAVGSLMGRSLGTVMASSFADDGLVWGGGGGRGDDAFFHENVSPSTSPVLAPAISNSMSNTTLSVGTGTNGFSSRRMLFRT